MKYYYSITLVLLVFGNLFYNLVYAYSGINCPIDTNYTSCTSNLSDHGVIACQSYIVPITLNYPIPAIFVGNINKRNISVGFFTISPYKNGEKAVVFSYCPRQGRNYTTPISHPKTFTGIKCMGVPEKI